MNKAINEWAKGIRKNATKHPSWSSLVEEMRTRLSLTIGKQFTREEIEHAMAYLFDTYDPRVLASREFFKDEAWQQQMLPNPFRSLTSIDEHGNVNDVFVSDPHDLQQLHNFLQGDPDKELQNDGLNQLWKSIKYQPPNDDNLPYFVFFAYIHANEKVEGMARNILHTHPLSKKIAKIFLTKTDPNFFLRELHRKLDFDIAKIVNVLLLYDDQFPSMEQHWFNLCINVKLPFRLVPAIFQMTSLSLVWGSLENSGSIDELKQFKSLKKLNAWLYSRHVFPEPQMMLPELEEVVIGGRLKNVTVDIRQLRQLKELSFTLARFTKLTSEIFEAPQLILLQLNKNSLKALPEIKASKSKLKVLDLTSNVLDSLPESVSRLSDLEELILAKNQFRTLPTSIAALNKLVRLDVSHNQLTELPAHFSQVGKIREIICYNNQITHVADEIANLKQLQVLDLRFNPIAESRLQWIREKMPDTKVIYY